MSTLYDSLPAPAPYTQYLSKIHLSSLSSEKVKKHFSLCENHLSSPKFSCVSNVNFLRINFLVCVYSFLWVIFMSETFSVDINIFKTHFCVPTCPPHPTTISLHSTSPPRALFVCRKEAAWHVNASRGFTDAHFCYCWLFCFLLSNSTLSFRC